MKVLNVIGNILATILFIPIGIVASVAITVVLFLLLMIAVPARLVCALWKREPLFEDNLF